MSQHHTIPSTPENMVLGYLDATTPPVLHVESGDTPSPWRRSRRAGGRRCRRTCRCRTPYLAALDALPDGPGPHFITGPVFVRGARPGDTLQVDILAAEPTMDWGFVAILPLLGTLPDEFTEYETIHPPIDRARGTTHAALGHGAGPRPVLRHHRRRSPEGMGPLRLARAPHLRRQHGQQGTEARRHALPSVFNEGALFMAGDGHGVQGDGEVCVTALETGLSGTFRLTVRRDFPVTRPFAETPTDLMSIGLDEDLDDAAKQAVREMVHHVCARTSLTRNQAYMLCSLAGNLRVTQTVDGNKGVHMLLAKSLL